MQQDLGKTSPDCDKKVCRTALLELAKHEQISW